jgi:hypothetical protein
MGIFKDVRKLQKAGKEMSAGYDPVAQMKAASAQMQQVTKQQQLVTDGTAATATVNALRDTGSEINMQPLTAVEITIFPAGMPPFPSSMSVVGHAALSGLAVGSRINVKYDPADPNTAVFVGPAMSA